MSLDPLLGKGRIRASGVMANPAASRGWLGGRVILDHRRWTCREADLTWSAPSHVVILTRRGGTSLTSITCAGETSYRGMDRPGSLSFVPANVVRDGSYRDADLVYTALWIDPDFTSRLGIRNETLPILLNQRDTAIAAALQAFQEDLAAGVEFDSGYVEHLTGFIVHRIAQLDRRKVKRKTYGALSGGVMRRLEDFIDAHLASEMTLQQLADIARLPVDTFARRFKATTGLAPYAFILEQRVRHAEMILRAGETQIASVAARTGFCSQSHFSGTFKRLRGITPAAFARAVPES
ncbi:helix-turn-helix domain-containing protein [Rhodopseudomonas boonkerdii]|uniref:helix-turn-helix domain-containing protein n=1 Tax=Rhodopseudomonas boonkerdii TaxID=475937 RepID=UPI001E492B89|nr:AraC family transcriptional regulator [Rhodopseudomonas boonkerdii]